MTRTARLRLAPCLVLLCLSQRLPEAWAAPPDATAASGAGGTVEAAVHGGAPEIQAASGPGREVPLGVLTLLVGRRVRLLPPGGTWVTGHLVAVDDKSVTLLVPPQGDLVTYDRGTLAGVRAIEGIHLAPTGSSVPSTVGASGPLRTVFEMDVKLGFASSVFYLGGIFAPIAGTTQVLLGAHRGHFTGAVGLGFGFNQLSLDGMPNSGQSTTSFQLAPTLTIDVARFAEQRARLYLLLAIFGSYTASNAPTSYTSAAPTQAVVSGTSSTSLWSGGFQLGLGCAGAVSRQFQIGFEVLAALQKGIERIQSTYYPVDADGHPLATQTTSTSGDLLSASVLAQVVGTFRAGD